MFDERRRNAWWESLVEVYKMYREQLHSKGYYDYSDMIIEVITQLEQNTDLLAQVQSSYEYILIDEFQDTNAAQLRLSYLVANNPVHEGKPNIMVVGDDDQSIFAFNGAELNNMLRFRETYESAKTIVLTKNYRSHQTILNTAENIISQANERLVYRTSELTKTLTAQSNVNQGEILHIEYPTQDHQLFAIAESVENKWKGNPEGDIAVLARNHDSLRKLSAYLAAKNVPVRYEQQNNIIEQPLVMQIITVSEIVGAIQNGDKKRANYFISKLLAFENWQIPPIDLWKFATSQTRSSEWLSALLESKNANLKKIGNWLLWLSQLASSESLPIIMENIIGLRDGPDFTSPIHDTFIKKRKINSEYIDGLSGLRKLQSIVNDISNESNLQPTLQDFLRFIHVTQTSGKPLTDESWFVSGDKAINLLTIHKAKGLEFDTVYLIDAIDPHWQPKHRGRRPPANLPLQPYGELYDDYVRLAYVAVTRAKESFLVSSYQFDNQGRQLLATPLIDAIEKESKLDDSSFDSIQILESALRWPRLSTTDEKSLLKSRLEDYTLNATAFLQYLDVKSGGPLHFLQTQLLRLPQVTTTSMAYGTSIHKSLQSAQLLINEGTFSLKEVLATYKKALESQPLFEQDLERFTSHGESILTNLFNKLNFTLQKDDTPELTIKNAHLGPARIGGTFDHVSVQNNIVQISDYKTGAPLSTFNTTDQLKAIKAWRHKNQLQFYSHLFKQSSHFKKGMSIQTQMIYVEAESTKQLYLQYASNEDSLLRTEMLIHAVWNNIMNLSFPDTDDYPQTINGIHAFEEDLLKQ